MATLADTVIAATMATDCRWVNFEGFCRHMCGGLGFSRMEAYYTWHRRLRQAMMWADASWQLDTNGDVELLIDARGLLVITEYA